MLLIGAGLIIVIAMAAALTLPEKFAAETPTQATDTSTTTDQSQATLTESETEPVETTEEEEVVTDTTETEPESTPTPTPTPTVQSYTLADIRVHGSREDCWTAIAGDVYNLTSAISSHPGGARAISKLCGIDGTSIFSAQHGIPSQQYTHLQGLKIGVLAQ